MTLVSTCSHLQSALLGQQQLGLGNSIESRWNVSDRADLLSAKRFRVDATVFLPFGKFSSIWDVFFHLGSFLPFGKLSSILEVFFHLGSFVPFRKFSSTLEDFYHSGRFLPLWKISSMKISSIPEVFFRSGSFLPSKGKRLQARVSSLSKEPSQSASADVFCVDMERSCQQTRVLLQFHRGLPACCSKCHQWLNASSFGSHSGNGCFACLVCRHENWTSRPLFPLMLM
jgi:hypothetical protein